MVSPWFPKASPAASQVMAGSAAVSALASLVTEKILKGAGANRASGQGRAGDFG